MKFKIITIFPEIYQNIFKYGITQKAINNNLLSIDIINLRDYSVSLQVDDSPYGGGPGMVMMLEPLVNAILANKTNDCEVVLTSPDGDTFDQKIANEYANSGKNMIIICGRYAGVDQRFIDNYVDKSLSIGNFVLTGGELVAACYLDAIARLIPGVLGNPDSIKNESFRNNRLQYPQYTKPREYNNMKVPEILLSGNHAKIESWRSKKALERTEKIRPDLLLTNNQAKDIKK